MADMSTQGLRQASGLTTNKSRKKKKPFGNVSSTARYQAMKPKMSLSDKANDMLLKMVGNRSQILK